MPAISGAEPWTGSKSDGFARVGSKFADGFKPSEPVTAPERSVRMSPKRLEATNLCLTINAWTKRLNCQASCIAWLFKAY